MKISLVELFIKLNSFSFCYFNQTNFLAIEKKNTLRTNPFNINLKCIEIDLTNAKMYANRVSTLNYNYFLYPSYIDWICNNINVYKIALYIFVFYFKIEKCIIISSFQLKINMNPTLYLDPYIRVLQFEFFKDNEFRIIKIFKNNNYPTCDNMNQFLQIYNTYYVRFQFD